MLCTLDRTIFENRDTGFCIASFKTKDEAVPGAARSPYSRGDRLIRFTAVGYHFPSTSAIEVDIDGTWENGKHGMQMNVLQCTEIIPRTKDGIVAYLSSGLIKGIGEKKAKAIVAAFGLDTIEIMEHDPKRLLEIKGITEKKLEMIEESFGKSRAIREIVSYLAPYGVSVKKCSKIRDEFGVNAMDVLKNSPFELCRISGFGFKTVDDIARKTQCRPDDPLRIKGALRFVLDESMLDGHLYLDKETIRAKAHELLNEGYQNEVVSLQTVHNVLCAMVKEKSIVHDDGALFKPRNYENELETAEAIAGILSEKSTAVDITDELAESQKSLGIMLSPKQAEAVRMCFSGNISIITGGPGTGKTTVLKVILDVYRRVKPKGEVLLTAPTGRAARRMEESTGAPASTLHSALGLVTDEDDTGTLNDTSDLTQDFIITDEFSMVDMALAKELFTRMKPGASILLVGDADQLPSVGAGNVFRELMKCGQIPVTCLDLVFRQANTSRIALNASMMKDSNTNLLFGDDFLFLPGNSEAEAAEIVCREYMKEIAEHGLDRVQILSPFKSRGESCVKKLNDRIREDVNPHEYTKPELKHGSRIFRLGDRVLQTRNMDDISNGDVGFVKSVYIGEDNDSTITVSFGDGRSHEYGTDELEMLELAYAMTIHKSQGSEYDTVIIPMMSSHYIMLRRNLIYTAITRAKKKVIIVGQKKALYTAINKNDIDGRNTRLAERIQRLRSEQK